MTALRTALVIALALLLPACATHRTAEKQAAPPAHAEPWYEAEIRAYEKADEASPPPPGRVLFIGSSSIRVWHTLAEDMAPAPVLNRGFGGSKTQDVLDVFDRVVYPYHPAAIVYYCGDNDLGETNTDARAAADGFIAFAEMVDEQLPGTPILYLAIKPSPSRWGNRDAVTRANAMVAEHAHSAFNVEFVDVASCLLGPNGTPNPAMYTDDDLHLSEAGYDAWAPIVRARLFDTLRTR